MLDIENQICERCNNKTSSTKMSYFNKEMCCPACIKKEREHPKFKEAQEAEMLECLKGNYNFEGIGKPEDL